MVDPYSQGQKHYEYNFNCLGSLFRQTCTPIFSRDGWLLVYDLFYQSESFVERMCVFYLLA